ncbi:DNA polymerase, partial [Klebsiella pneumoniae]|uniref:DNA polymerase n=1 Tax=Klebsiella pneumoniae TaxID=573 RepID=UPI0034D33ABF
MFPCLNPLDASTGRFTCSCPNIQQIPKRNKLFAALCRKMFVTENGKQWISADWSN